MKRPEQILQKACVVWLELQRRMGRLNYYHVPNGTYRSKKMAWIMKQQGLRAGVPDLVLLFPGGRTIFVELKSRYGKPSPAQKEFHEELRLMGFEVHIVKTLDELMNVYHEYERKKK